MPFIQTGQPHRDPLSPEDHSAFNICLSAHMERTCLWVPGKESGNDGGVDTTADEHFRTSPAVPEFQQSADGFNPGKTAAGGTAGQYRVKSCFPCTPIGFQRIGLLERHTTMVSSMSTCS